MERNKSKTGNNSIKEVPVEPKLPKGQLLNDTLKNADGKWSRKNITCLIAFLYAMFYASMGLFLNRDIEEFVVIGFLSLSAGLLGLSTWEKKNL